MLGAFAVGKTSLVRRFVSSCFSDQYQTNHRRHSRQKSMTVDGTSHHGPVGDLYGEDEFQKLRSSHLRGSSGYLLVLTACGGRRWTLPLNIQERASDTLGPVPFVVLINKHDRRAEWDITDQDLAQLAQRGWSAVMSSAKTGQGVEEAFTTLAPRHAHRRTLGSIRRPHGS